MPPDDVVIDTSKVMIGGPPDERATYTPTEATEVPVGSLDYLAERMKEAGEKITAAANGAFEEFLAGLPELKLNLEEATDVRVATQRLALAGVLAINPETRAHAEQMRKDALAILANVTAGKVKDAELHLVQAVAKIFTTALNTVLGLITTPAPTPQTPA